MTEPDQRRCVCGADIQQWQRYCDECARDYGEAS